MGQGRVGLWDEGLDRLWDHIVSGYSMRVLTCYGAIDRLHSLSLDRVVCLFLWVFRSQSRHGQLTELGRTVDVPKKCSGGWPLFLIESTSDRYLAFFLRNEKKTFRKLTSSSLRVAPSREMLSHSTKLKYSSLET